MNGIMLHRTTHKEPLGLLRLTDSTAGEHLELANNGPICL
jgi:hypothetical protein